MRPSTLLLLRVPEDERFRNELAAHLAPLRQRRIIEIALDGRLGPGALAEPEAQAWLQRADFVVALVSVNFLAYDGAEAFLRQALEANKPVVPVLVRPVDVRGTLLEHLDLLPANRRPVSRWDEPDEGWLEVVGPLRALIESAAPGAGEPAEDLARALRELEETGPPDPARHVLQVLHASEDEPFRDALAAHLTTLCAQGAIKGWESSRLEPGVPVDDEVQARLLQADIVVPLVSLRFLVHDGSEALLHEALAANKLVVPVLIGPAYMDGALVERLDPLPRDRPPVESWDDADMAWLEVTEQLRQRILEWDPNSSQLTDALTREQHHVVETAPLALPRKVFYLSAPEDVHDRDCLLRHMAPLRQQGLIKVWHRDLMMAGTDWRQEIDARLQDADLLVALVSAHLLADEDCQEQLRQALQAGKRIVPVLVRPVFLAGSLLDGLQALPRSGGPVSNWPYPDMAWTEIVLELREAIEATPARPLAPAEALALARRRIEACQREGSEVLDLAGLGLHDLPPEIRTIPWLTRILIHDNPGLAIPDGIAATENPRRVLDYYFRTAEPGAKQPLNEFKLVLVGRGLVGKTTLVHRLVRSSYKEFPQTHGIQITKWPVLIDGEWVRAHVWDFGGQEIMHGTHRFFMTERALYLVLITGREGTEDHDAEYWLSLVRSFAGDVPVIVLLHKWADQRLELNRELLLEKYGPNLTFLETDSKTGHGISQLEEQIRRLAGGLSGLKAAWPTAWLQVKQELPAQEQSWVRFDDFRAFCSERGVSNGTDQEALADSLHDLGLMLCYRRDEALRRFGVLNPQWATQGIYSMLTSERLREAGGQFTVQAFAQVLPAEAYPAQLHPYLLALMRKFRLCHPLDENGERHLIPELLSKEEPKLDDEFPPEQCLNFLYRYESVLPEGLLSRFIVDTYVHREPSRAWRTGVVLERDRCSAMVRGDVQGRLITIRVKGIGNGRRALLGIIRAHFERIHRDYKKLPVTALVPIPGYPEAQVEYELLVLHEQEPLEDIWVKIGAHLRRFKVRELLDGVDLPLARSVDRAPFSVFIAYSHKDEIFQEQLCGFLLPYERAEVLRVWSGALVEPGQDWDAEVSAHLERAQIVILLLSKDFIGSARCMDRDLPRAMARRERGGCEIVPVLLRACRYDLLPIGSIKAIEPGGKPVERRRSKDEAWMEVTRELDRVIEALKARGI